MLQRPPTAALPRVLKRCRRSPTDVTSVPTCDLASSNAGPVFFTRERPTLAMRPLPPAIRGVIRWFLGPYLAACAVLLSGCTYHEYSSEKHFEISDNRPKCDTSEL